VYGDGKMLPPPFERILPWRVAIVLLRVRGMESARGREKRAGAWRARVARARRLLAYPRGNAEFAQGLFLILRSMKRTRHWRSKLVPAKFFTRASYRKLFAC